MSLEQIKENLKRKPVAQQEQGVYVSVSLISFDDDTSNIDSVNKDDNDIDNVDANTNATMITLQKQNLDYESIMKKLRESRKASLDAYGEYGFENLVFKELRNSGYIDKIRDAMLQLNSRNLSLT